MLCISTLWQTYYSTDNGSALTFSLLLLAPKACSLKTYT